MSGVVTAVGLAFVVIALLWLAWRVDALSARVNAATFDATLRRLEVRVTALSDAVQAVAPQEVAAMVDRVAVTRVADWSRTMDYTHDAIAKAESDLAQLLALARRHPVYRSDVRAHASYTRLLGEVMALREALNLPPREAL